MRKILGLVALLALTAGCAAPSPGGLASPIGSPSSTVRSPSASASLSPDQSAALAALNGYQATKDKLFAEPGKYSTHEVNAMLAPYSGYAMIKGNAASLTSLRKAGDRFPSGPSSVWVQVSPVSNNHNERGLEVHITVCHDNSEVQRVNAKGVVLGTPAQKFSLRQFSVRKPGKTWRVFGEQAAVGECHR